MIDVKEKNVHALAEDGKICLGEIPQELLGVCERRHLGPKRRQKRIKAWKIER